MNDKSGARGDTLSELWSLYVRKEGKEQMPLAKTSNHKTKTRTSV